MKLLTWFIEPYSIVKNEMSYLSKLKKNQNTSSQEISRIYQLQSFNILLTIVYSVFFIAFIVYTIMLFVVNLYALSGIIVGLVMMTVIKLVLKKRYLKRRDAFLKDDPRLIKP
ncbi:hypothetical protein ACFQPF_12930 [Fictibacillus iocasae]|uniref:Uncharacterized protein n=1 Tax=Fictibacillus iocasae TaxID=2715437 RepID=A0ABW2NS64_9BACL